jgi:hypothetical protein
MTVGFCIWYYNDVKKRIIFMKHSKSQRGAGGGSADLSGLLSNYDAAAHERVQFVKGALTMVDMLVEVRITFSSNLLSEKMSFFSYQEGGGVGFSRLTKLDSRKVHILCIQLKGNTISFHLRPS